MLLAIEIVLLLAGLPLAFFAFYGSAMFVGSLVALIRQRPPASAGRDARFVVLVPAHDEEVLIAQPVQSILGADYPRDRLHLVVIADNCTDRTAAIAREHGATCLERHDTTRRGKPYALDWAIRQLDLDGYDALVIIDADTRIHPQFFERMAAHLAAGSRVLQGYFGVLNPDETWLTRLALLPGALKFRLHFPAKALLGWSCPLAGNGMCFAIDIIKRFGWNAFSLTENWEYWAMLTLHDIRVDSAPDAVIYSQVADKLSAGESQRMRWMRGRMQTSQKYAGPLWRAGLRSWDLMKLDAVVEVERPSHAMLLFWSVLYAVVAAGAFSIWPTIDLPFWLALAVVAAQGIYFFTGFLLDRPPLKTWLALAMVPGYLVWKLLVSVRGAFGAGSRAWIRTKRNEP